VKKNISRKIKRRKQQQNISLLDFLNVEKQKFLPNWQAELSGLE